MPIRLNDALATQAARRGQSTPTWSHKAVSDEKTASGIVGGFSDDDHRLYGRGLEHIKDRHERPGQFTIGEVIDAERAREQVAADADQRRNDAALAAREAAASRTTYLNDASQYAQRLHALIYADAVASSFLAHPDEHGPQDLYEVATRMADDAGDAASVIDAPDEFSDSGAAFEKYAEQLEQTYRQIAESLNNPSLENSHNVLQAVALDNEYTEEAMSAFKRDLANSHFTKKEKQRILNRLI